MSGRKIVAAAVLGVALIGASAPGAAQDMPSGMKDPSTAAGLVQACKSMLNSLAQSEIYPSGVTNDAGFGIQIGYCMGYLSAYQGIAQSIKSKSLIQIACIPRGLDLRIMARALIDALAAHPEWGGGNANGFAFAVFEANWPCQGGGRR